MPSKKTLSAEEEVIIAFANLSLVDDPKNMIPILDKVAQCTAVESGGEEALNKAKGLMADFYLNLQEHPSDSMLYLSYNDRLKQEGFFVTEFDENSFTEVERSCPGFCAVDMMEHIRRDLKIEGDNLNCIECHQLFFQYLVRSIAQGQEYSDLEKRFRECDAPMDAEFGPGVWHYFLSQARWANSRKIFIRPSHSGAQFHDKLVHDPIPPRLDPGSFNAVYQIPMGALLSFLLDEDRRRLLKCGHCGKLDIVNQYRSTRKYCDNCSPNNSKMWKMTAEEKQEAKRNSRKYSNARKQRWKQLIERLENKEQIEKIEMKIKELMLKGLSRDQAIRKIFPEEDMFRDLQDYLREGTYEEADLFPGEIKIQMT